MISLEERLREMEEPPGAELMDMDSLLRLAGYGLTLDGSFRIYHHQRWDSTWTFRNDWRLVPLGYARRVAEYLRLKLKEEGNQ